MKTPARIVLISITLILVAYFLRGINFREVYSLFIEADKIYFLLAFLSYGISILLFNLRSVYFIKNVKSIDYWFSLKTNFAGEFVNIITPGAQIGGDPVRAHYIGEKYKHSKTEIFGAVLADRLFHALVSLLFIFVAIAYILNTIEITSELRIIIQTVITFSVIVLIILILINFEKSRGKILMLIKKMGLTNFNRSKKKRSKLIEILTEHSKKLIKTFKRSSKNPKTIFLGIVISIIQWLIIYLSTYFLMLSFNIQVSYFIALVATSLTSFVADLSPTPGGVGVAEGFMALMFSALGINLSAAFSVAVLSRMIKYTYHFIFGGIALLHLEKKSGKIEKKNH